MGHIRKTTDSKGRVRYQARWVEHSPAKNKPKKPQATFDRRKDAADHIAAHRIDTARGSALDSDARRTPFRVYAKSWLATCEVKESTRDGYDAALRKYATKYWGNTPIGQIDVKAAREFKDWIVSQPTLRTPRSIRWAWHPFRAVLGQAVEDRALAYNPAVLVKLPTHQTYRRPDGSPARRFTAAFLNAGQVEQASQALKDRPPYDLLVRFAAYTGLRASEIAGLNVEDIYLAATPKQGTNTWSGKVHVHRTRKKIKGGWRVDTPKSERSTRYVRLMPWLAEDLHRYLANDHPQAKQGSPLFPNRRKGGYTHGRTNPHTRATRAGHRLNWSEPVEPSAFYRWVLKPVLCDMQLPTTRFQDLRHTFAALWLSNGGDIYELSEQMGHAGYRITIDTYAHLIPKADDAPGPLDARPKASPKSASNVVPLDRAN